MSRQFTDAFFLQTQLLPSNHCTEQTTVNRKLEQTLTFVYYIY